MKKNKSRRGMGLPNCRPEALERRTLLSAALQGPVASATAAAWYAQRVAALAAVHLATPAEPSFVKPGVKALQTSSPDPAGLTPTQIKAYYNFGLSFGSTPADGKGQTIAVIDAYDDPNIAADLKTFDTAYGLAAPPSFQVVSQTGSTSALPSADVGDPVNGSWATEESLDVEWAHALAPGAGIMVVECNSQNDSDLYTGVAYAAAAPKVSVISMSFGQSEQNYTPAQVAAIDPTFVTPPGHEGVTFLASSGDSGAYADGGPLAVSFPSSSPGVISVGGTTLNTNSTGGLASESAWSGSGGGLSILEMQTAAQKTAAGKMSGRADPDVSFDADPNSGVNICDSLDFSAATPFAVFGGTSFSSPAWGSILAITNQGRALQGKSPLDGRQQTIPALYSAYTNGSFSSVFNDITTGNNGFYDAGRGFDLVTGLGTPKVHNLVQELVDNTVHSTPPVIGAFTINPSVEDIGTNISLTASGITDTVGDIEAVNFYRNQGSTSTLLGPGLIDSAGNWNLTVSTSGLTANRYSYTAVAENNSDQFSPKLSTINIVVSGQATPTIGSFVVKPGSAAVGSNITLTASNVADTTGPISSVAFYLQTSTVPTLLGQGTTTGGGRWTFTTSTAAFVPGHYHFIALATAVSGLLSAPSKATDTITLGPPISLLVNTIKDQIDPQGSKTISLRDAVAVANRGIGQVTIEFDPAVFSSFQTIALTGATLSLTDTAAPTTIIGPSAGVAVSGAGSIEVFSITVGAVVSMSNVTIVDGVSGGSGGGLINAGITTLTNVTVTGNSNTGFIGNGGGIENDGTLSLTDSSVVNNSTTNGNGGGIYNTGTLTVTDTTLSGNTAFNGGGMGNYGTANLVGATISGNTALTNGGAIENASRLTLVDSTLSGNTGQTAGALYNSAGYGSTATSLATLTNSTVTENTSTFSDGAITNDRTDKLYLNDSTIVDNSTTGSYGGVDNQGTATIANSIIAGNSATATESSALDVSGAFDSKGHNLIGKADGSSGWITGDYVGTNAAPLNPHLSPLGNFGGSTLTMLPLSGSLALGHGAVSLIPKGIKTDERGYSRIIAGKLDIGSTQVQGITPLKFYASQNQTATAGQSALIRLGTFNDSAPHGPYTIVIDWGDGSPNTMAPQNAAGGLNAQSHAFGVIGNCVVSIVVVDAVGNVSNLGSFSVKVSPAPLETLMVNSSADRTDVFGNKTITLRDAVNRADTYFGPVKIEFDPRVFAAHRQITLLTTVLTVNNSFGVVTIEAPPAGITISGGGNTDVLLVDPGARAVLQDVTITGGTGHFTGAITNHGALTIVDSTISGNTAEANGAGINNSGVLTMINSTLAKNTANFYNNGYFSVGVGGALYNSGDATLDNVTITGNTAYYGGGVDSIGSLTIANTIVAGNSLSTLSGTDGSDVVGVASSKGHNLIGITGSSDGWISSDLTGNAGMPLNPHLSALGNNGGATQTCVPQHGSAAIGNGSIALIPAGVTTDQRGKTRTIKGKTDIGATEV